MKTEIAESLQIRRKSQLMSLTLVPMFTVLMIISAKITIPTPFLPLTLQVPVAILSGLLLGGRLGLLSQMLYILLGLVGLPVFATGGGLGYVFTGSFGYLLGFAVAAFVGGSLADRLDRPSSGQPVPLRKLLVIAFFSLIICYLIGIMYLFLLSNFYSGYSGGKNIYLLTIAYGVFPFLVKDMILWPFGSELARRLWRFRYTNPKKSPVIK